MKICKKYIKKIKNLLCLIGKLETNIKISESKEILVNELNLTNDKFYNTLYNPKLIDSIFECQIFELNKNKNLEESNDESFFDSKFSLVDVVQNLENQVKSQQNQIENLKKRKVEVKKNIKI